MEYDKTAFQYFEPDSNTHVLRGIWVIDNFLFHTYTSVSDYFPFLATRIKLSFLNPLNRISTRVSMIVSLESVSNDIPVDLNAQILNKNISRNVTKQTQVTFAKNAKKSYMDFPIRWMDLTEYNGFVKENRKLNIQFEFRSPSLLMRKTNIDPQTILEEDMAFNIRKDDYFCWKTIQESEKDSFGIMSYGNNDCLNSVVTALYMIPKFRRMVYGINTFGFEGTNNFPLTLQYLFASMQTNKYTANSLDLVKSLKWSPDHLVLTQVKEAFSAIIEGVKEQIPDEKFNDLFRIKITRSQSCINLKYESKVIYDVFYWEVCLEENKSLIELLSNFNNNYEEIDNLYVPRKGKQKGIIKTEIKELPNVVIIILNRYKFDNNMSIVKIINNNLKIPSQCNLNIALQNEKEELWELQSVISQYGMADSNIYQLNIRAKPRINKWIRFHSGRMMEILENDVLNVIDPVALIYTKINKEQDIFELIDDDMIPKHVLSPLIPKSVPFLVTIIQESDCKKSTLRGEIGCGIKGNVNFPAREEQLISEFRDVIANHMKISDQQKLKMWSISANGKILKKLKPEEKCEELFQFPFVFIKILNDDKIIDLDENEILIFLKIYYEKATYPLQFIASKIINKNSKISSLNNFIYSRLDCEESPLSFFVENDDYSAELLNESKTLSDYGFKDGDTIIFQFLDKDIKLSFKFNEVLPIEKAPPITVCYNNDINDDSYALIDLTSSDQFEFKGNPPNVELFYDYKYHLAIIDLLDYSKKVSFGYLIKIPFSYPLSELIDLLINLEIFTKVNALYFEMNDETIQEINIQNTKNLKSVLLQSEKVKNGSAPFNIYVSS